MVKNKFSFAAKEVFLQLPVWFIVFTALQITHINMVKTPIPHPQFIWTAVFPLFWVYLFLNSRIKKGDVSDPEAYKLAILLPALAAIFILAVIWPHAPREYDRLLYEHEVTTAVWVVLLMIHCLATRGWKGLVVFFGVGLLYGALLESSGVTMDFFREHGYHLYAPGFLRKIFSAPAVTIFGWTTVFYPAIFVIDALLPGRSKIYRAVSASMIGLFIDLQVDPVATASGLWSWNPDLPAGFLGVPILNFVSWFWAVAVFAYAYYFVMEKSFWSAQKKIGVLVLLIPVCQAAAGLGLFGTMAALEGFSGPSWKILIKSIIHK